MNRTKICFNTANLVGRVTGYRFELSNWMAQHRATIEATNEGAWRAICDEIARAGFRAVEIWEAHASPEALDAAKAAAWKRALEDAGLTPVAYAGGFRPETARVCEWLGIGHVDGGLAGISVDEAEALSRSSGVKFNAENHPETSASEMVARVAGGSPNLGVCVDTGWLGTQGVNAPEAVRSCARLVRHVHVKDVLASGGHETCALGTGVVDLGGVFRELDAAGYDGWYSWEDEPESRNPFDSAVRNRRWIEERLAPR